MNYTPPRRSLWSTCVIMSCFVGVALVGCAQSTPLGGETGSGGTGETGGDTGGSIATGGSETTGTGGTGTGGRIGTGGTTGTGGTGTGGAIGATGGTTGTGGAGTGGAIGTGGAKGGTTGTGGLTGTGGTVGTGGAKGGATGTGGTGTGGAKGGTTGTGGATATGGTGGAGTGTDPCSVTTLPSGGTQHSSSNASGTAAGLDWTIWSNGSGGSITTFPTPAFSAAWNNSGDFLARVGVQWNDTKTYDQLGTINAEYSETKTGSGGGYSYIGIYGWSVNPCVEWYIVDDSYNKMPVNPGSTTNKGTATIDGGTYTLYTRPTSGTGGSKCSGVSNWTQFYSVRQTARQCGQISISQHFAAWAAAGMTLGKMDQAQILVEVGGGSGSISFPVANVTAQ